MSSIDQVFAAALDAAWEGATWTHERVCAGAERIFATEYCDGGDPDCATCAAAEESAERCVLLVAEARKLAKRDTWADMLGLLEQAREEELQWGDSPWVDSIIATLGEGRWVWDYEGEGGRNRNYAWHSSEEAALEDVASRLGREPGEPGGCRTVDEYYADAENPLGACVCVGVATYAAD